MIPDLLKEFVRPCAGLNPAAVAIQMRDLFVFISSHNRIMS
jgi:hypothetical protein